MKKNRLSIVMLLLFSILFSCSDYMHVDEAAFLGTWELKGRTMYEGMKLNIIKENGKFIGRLTSIPSNKYAQLFLDTGNIWLLGIERTSNYSFKIEEKKIASELFSLYGLPTTTIFYATFSKKKDRINLSQNSNSTKDSDIFYQRIP